MLQTELGKNVNSFAGEVLFSLSLRLYNVQETHPTDGKCYCYEVCKAIFGEWKNDKGEEFLSFAIITTESNKLSS